MKENSLRVKGVKWKKRGGGGVVAPKGTPLSSKGRCLHDLRERGCRLICGEKKRNLENGGGSFDSVCRGTVLAQLAPSAGKAVLGNGRHSKGGGGTKSVDGSEWKMPKKKSRVSMATWKSNEGRDQGIWTVPMNEWSIRDATAWRVIQGRHFY